MQKMVHYLVLSTLWVCAFSVDLTACGTPSTHHVSNKAQTTLTRSISITDGFMPHTGDGYTIIYPDSWKFSANTTNTGGYVGDSFIEPTNGYIFHVYPSQDQTSAATILNHLLTSDMHSHLLPVAATITINGVVWQQGKALTTNLVTGKPMEIMGWVAKNAVAPQRIPYFVLHADGDPGLFEQYSSKYFMPMLRSFQFTG
ncbi:hypothetical protein [Dictyobacter kobayashii]|uniref:Uncharacterized protein n=1 Tax=Dictyobacter kobayashii TaxID=2014872 RepID=A0A402AW56_9CHLR|nr:hypothetical protein [Dictyobacter kobayashii]GCE23371.1 hypothetical protein KDK_71710 [Dictyobacter kobayashii]